MNEHVRQVARMILAIPRPNSATVEAQCALLWNTASEEAKAAGLEAAARIVERFQAQAAKEADRADDDNRLSDRQRWETAEAQLEEVAAEIRRVAREGDGS